MNLTLVGPVVSEVKIFIECGRPTTDGRTDRRRMTEANLSSGELKSSSLEPKG